MTRKILAMLLAIAMVFTLFPFSALSVFADEEEEFQWDVQVDGPGSYTAVDGQTFRWAAPENGNLTFTIDSPDNWSYFGYIGGQGMVYSNYGEDEYGYGSSFEMYIEAGAYVNISFYVQDYQPDGENTVDFTFTFTPDGTGTGGYVMESTHHVSGDGSYEAPYVYNTIDDFVADWTNRKIGEGGQLYITAPLGGKTLTVNSRYTNPEMAEYGTYCDFQVQMQYLTSKGNLSEFTMSIFDAWAETPVTSFTFDADGYQHIIDCCGSWINNCTVLDEPWKDGSMVTICYFGPASSPYFMAVDMIVEGAEIPEEPAEPEWEVYLTEPGSYTAISGQTFYWTAPENGTLSFGIDSETDWSYFGRLDGYGVVWADYGNEESYGPSFSKLVEAGTTLEIKLTSKSGTVDFHLDFTPDGTGVPNYNREVTHQLSGDGSYSNPYVYATVEDFMADFVNIRLPASETVYISAPLGGKTLTVNARYSRSDLANREPDLSYWYRLEYRDANGNESTISACLFEEDGSFTFDFAGFDSLVEQYPFLENCKLYSQPWGKDDMVTFNMRGVASSYYYIVVDMVVEDADPVVASGTCGDNATWALNADGTLTISGTGTMHNYARPWVSYKDQITSIVIEEGITAVGDQAFADSYSVASISLPESVTYIGASAFRYCEQVTSITLPSNVEHIGDAAFECCANLKTIFVPASVTSLGDNAFGNCYRLDGIWVDAGNPNYSSDDAGVLFNKDQTVLMTAPGALTSYVIPETVITIESFAFDGCFGLEEVTISSSVVSIGSWAFSDCDLKEITIPSNVEEIRNGAFRYTELTRVTFQGSNLSIHVGAFEYCDKLSEIIFEGSAPDVENAIFDSVNATVYYPDNDPTWTEEVMSAMSERAYIIWSPIHGHAYEAVVTAPTCEAGGYTTYTCSCGDSYVSDATDALGHNFVDGLCGNCGQIQVLEGESTLWTPESEEAPAIRINAQPEQLMHVYLNGELVDPSNYTVTQGSTVITFHADFLSTLDTGVYALTVEFTTGTAVAELTIAPDYILGDVNGDGEVDTTDAYYIVMYYNEMLDLTETQLAAADVNGDEEVDTTDAYYIVMFYNEMIDAFPAEENE